jgi:hypothetical protein
MDQSSIRSFHRHIATRSADEMEVLTARQIDDKRNSRFIDMDITRKHTIMDNGVSKWIYLEVQRQPVLAMNTDEFNCCCSCQAR